MIAAFPWDIPLSFGRPEWLWLLLLAPATALGSWRALAGLGPVRRAAALAVRSLVIVATALTLADVNRVLRNDDLTVLFLMDRSLSVREHADRQQQFMEDVTRDIPADDRTGVIDFAREAFLEQLPMKGGYFLERGRLPELPNVERTNVAAAIRLAMAMFPHDSAKRIVLMSDGNDNMGDVLSEARRAKADGVSIDVAPLWFARRNEVYFEKLSAPTYAERGELVAIRGNLHATSHASGRLDVYHNGAKVALRDEYTRMALRPGNNAFVMKLPVETDGVQRFETRFVPDDPNMDAIVDNNQASSFSFVSGRGKVAVMSMDPAIDGALVDALRRENVQATLVDVTHEIPDPAGMIDYACIVLANVPANVFTEEQQRTLAAYVEDMGGGLIMTGGDDGFGAGGWIGTPLEAVLPVELEIKHKRIIPRGALVLIMHSCEFERGNAWGVHIAKKAVDTISSRDFIGVLAYAMGGESWEVPIQLATNKSAVKNAIDRMGIGDMPDFDTTMSLALKGLTATDASQKHIIMVSDGDPSPPSKSVMDGLIAQQITVSTIGVGFGSHVVEPPLRDIASRTGGRYYPVRNPRTLPQIFVKESKVVRRPLIVEETFVPTVNYAFSDLLTGIDPSEALPQLDGMVLTTPKDAAQLALVRATTDGNDPLLAHWQRGLGRVVAFTSGYWPKWGTAWVRWSKYSKFWAQVLRWTMRQDAPANLDTYTVIEGNTGRVIIEAMDKDADYVNFLDLRATVLHPGRGGVPMQFVQTGPGRYEGTFEIDQTGQYVATVNVFQSGAYQGSLHTGASVPYSPELKELSTNDVLLEQVAEMTGGRVLDVDATQSSVVFDHDLPPTESRRPAWEWALTWLLLPAFLLDVACRRLASWVALSLFVEVLILAVLLFGMDVIHTHWWGVLGVILLAELVGWTIRFRSIQPCLEWLTHTAAVLSRTGDRSAAALAQLRTVKDRVREERESASVTGGGASGAESTRRPTAATVDPRRRYDTGDTGDRPPEIGLDEALGGATESAIEAPKRPTSATDAGVGESEATTSRLLRAKRRARGDTQSGTGPAPPSDDDPS
ncbi:MAG: VWA domain-containing protein [Phycisphaerales bacterium]|nr:VWA domain-containing protein [Phycisphaerales bacterium]